MSDDGSTDETVEQVKEFAKSAPFRVIVHCNDVRLGYGENFLMAVKFAGGDYVAFCDQDDIWHSNKLAMAVEKLSRTGADLFAHTAELVDENGNRIGSTFSQGIRKSMLSLLSKLAENRRRFC